MFFFLFNAEQVTLVREDINSLERELASLNSLISGLVSCKVPFCSRSYMSNADDHSFTIILSSFSLLLVSLLNLLSCNFFLQDGKLDTLEYKQVHISFPPCEPHKSLISRQH